MSLGNSRSDIILMLGYNAGLAPESGNGDVCRFVERGKKLNPFGL